MSSNYIRKDNVHNEIILPGRAKEIVQTEEFSRLNHIVQNGFLYLKFPNAQHTRFQHSLGSAHIANKWFQNIVDSHVLYKSGTVTLKTAHTLEFERTKSLLKSLRNKEKKKKWQFAVTTAALCHDIGHGPLSHSLEDLKLMKSAEFGWNQSALNEIRMYFTNSMKTEIEHGDIGLLYVDKILHEAKSEKEEIVRICALFNKEFRDFCFDKKLISDQDEKDLITLFSPLISSFCDVDRFDYLLRDSLNTGTTYNFELDRMIRNIVPILIRKHPEKKELQSGFISKLRDVHLVDHFLLSLYQFYIQVLYHEDQVIAYDQLRRICTKRQFEDALKFNWDWHRNAHDLNFLEAIDSNCKIRMVSKLRSGTFDSANEVYITNSSAAFDSTGWTAVKQDGIRKILKDAVDFFLIDGHTKKPEFENWLNRSLVATKLRSESFSQTIWWKNNKFFEYLNQLTVIPNQTQDGNSNDEKPEDDILEAGNKKLA